MENEQQTNSVTQLADLVKRLEEANAKAEENLKRQAELIALDRMGGKTNAGTPPVEVKVESPQEYAKKILSGRK